MKKVKMTKLTGDQLKYLKILSKKKNPLTAETLKTLGVKNFPTLNSLVRQKLVSVRKSKDRSDRYNILEAGRAFVK